MKVVRVDSKKRVVLPHGKPGDWMLVEESEAGTYILKRIEVPKTPGKVASNVRKAVRTAPLKMQMDWEQLRKLTREP